MFWVYFVRDFYRPTPAAAQPVIDAPTPLSTICPPYNLSELFPLPPLDALPEPNIEQVQEDVLLLAQRLETMQAALAMSDRGRSAFLSAMSHELRTPLNAIMGFSDMMKSGVFGEMGNATYQQYATHIHESGALLLQKINDLLGIASMDIGALKMEEAECDLEVMLRELVEMHSHAAFARQQTVMLDCPPGIRLQVDRTKIICALSHLVTNALRHSPEGETVTVMVRIQPDEGLIFSVRDAGEGIPTEQLMLIRGALAAPVAYHHIECGGIGLGLALSKELIAAHGGRLMLDSVRYRGSVVALILPKERILSGMPRRKSDRARVELQLV